MTVYLPGRNETDSKKIVRSLHELGSGRSNAVGKVTLTANVTQTQVIDANCSEESAILLVPTTAHAASEFGNGTIYVPTVSNGSFIIQHANNAQTDRTYTYAISG